MCATGEAGRRATVEGLGGQLLLDQARGVVHGGVEDGSPSPRRRLTRTQEEGLPTPMESVVCCYLIHCNASDRLFAEPELLCNEQRSILLLQWGNCAPYVMKLIDCNVAL
jgi:hypothetical protein